MLEAVACTTGFIYYKKFKGTYWVVFIGYLLFIVLCENAGAVINSYQLDEINTVFYNYLVIPVEFMFFFWLFYRSLTGSRFIWLPIVCGGVYLASWLVDIIYVSRLHFFFTSMSYTIGNLLLLILILQFFAALVSSNSILVFKRNIMFWVSLGLLIFYLGSCPFYGLFNLLAYKHRYLYIAYCQVVFGLNYLMYIMFTISFIWGEPN